MPQIQKHLTQADRQKAYRDRLKDAAYAAPPTRPLTPFNADQAQRPTKRWSQLAATAESALAQLIEERKDWHEQRSDNWKESDRGEEFESQTEDLEQIIESLQELTDIPQSKAFSTRQF